ncbi:MAG: YegP family protein [Paracoccaceae bacterium]|nr:YegP family protein [Paracoccaceae bacterium]MDE2674596.1 YegP family protein [Paracoccaceae bacterium]
MTNIGLSNSLFSKTATFDIKPSTDGQFYFVLVAPNGKTIATSEMYTTKQSARVGIDAVKKYAPVANIDDKTLPGLNLFGNNL